VCCGKLLGDRRVNASRSNSQLSGNLIDLCDAVVATHAKQCSRERNDVVRGPAFENLRCDFSNEADLFVPQLTIAAEIHDVFPLLDEELLDRRAIGNGPLARVSSLHGRLGWTTVAA